MGDSGNDLHEVRFGRYVLRVRPLTAWEGFHLYDEVALLKQLGVTSDYAATMMASCLLATESMHDAETGEVVVHFRRAFIEECKHVGFGVAIQIANEVMQLQSGGELARSEEEAKERAAFFEPTQ